MQRIDIKIEIIIQFNFKRIISCISIVYHMI